MFTVGFVLEEFFTGLNDFVDNVDVDFPVVPAEVGVNDGVEFAEDLP